MHLKLVRAVAFQAGIAGVVLLVQYLGLRRDSHPSALRYLILAVLVAAAVYGLLLLLARLADRRPHSQAAGLLLLLEIISALPLLAGFSRSLFAFVVDDLLPLASLAVAILVTVKLVAPAPGPQAGR